ncbi:ABC transporter ATP-binding protein [Sphingomonas quercus]|uniref:ABC transporter ATP-binding protein n=1 Tax=Sphingomonas quercus TaxID=2842451 RepID=A0ABS6BLX8_9SPHN|nr:ABC transporter ATP-binding protein [Sphingomonas quercus]MBU3079320.1 ABC transporter ATP-binding protein [Sphingomonas quercus]
MNASLTVTHLARRHGAVQAAADIGFAVDAGEIVGLLGPNGAGKTTVIESIAGLIEPDEGVITICGIDARARPGAARQKLGVVLQSTGLQDKITPREAITLFARLHGTAADPAPLLARFGLDEKADAAFATLSGGQRQRLALALAFVGAPQLVLLDEPTTGLDPHIRREVHDHVRAMRDEGRAILVTTHDMAEAEQLCDRILILDRGRIVAEGTPAALIAEPSAAIRVWLQASAAPACGWPAALPHIHDLAGEGAELRFTTGDLNRALAGIIALLDGEGLAIAAMRAGRATLEDVLVQLTGRDPRG